MLQRTASYWETNRTLGHFDVLVVGGGMVGLWTAFHLKRQSPTLRLAIVEQLPSGQAGASTRNAGFACFGSPTELLDDLRHESQEDLLARLAWRYEGLQAWRSQFGEGDLGWQPGKGYEIFNTNQTHDWEAVLHNLDRLNALATDAGIPGTVYQEVAPPISTLLGCISIEHEAGLHAGMAHQALKSTVTALGVEYISGVAIPNQSEWRKDDPTWSLPTAQGLLCARHVVLATNAWTGALVNRTDVLPGRGQVLLTQPIAHLPYRGTYHADEGYLYFRNLGDCLLLGGGRNAFRQEEETLSGETTPQVQDYLEDYLRTVLLPGQAVEITDRWAGTMAFAPNGSKMPILESGEGTTIVARMGGMGVALSPEAGKKAAALVFGAL